MTDCPICMLGVNIAHCQDPLAQRQEYVPLEPLDQFDPIKTPEYRQVVTTPCKHCFHRGCLISYLKSDSEQGRMPRCPVDRTNLDLDFVQRVYPDYVPPYIPEAMVVDADAEDDIIVVPDPMDPDEVYERLKEFYVTNFQSYSFWLRHSFFVDADDEHDDEDEHILAMFARLLALVRGIIPGAAAIQGQDESLYAIHDAIGLMRFERVSIAQEVQLHIGGQQLQSPNYMQVPNDQLYEFNQYNEVEQIQNAPIGSPESIPGIFAKVVNEFFLALSIEERLNMYSFFKRFFQNSSRSFTLTRGVIRAIYAPLFPPNIIDIIAKSIFFYPYLRMLPYALPTFDIVEMSSAPNAMLEAGMTWAYTGTKPRRTILLGGKPYAQETEAGFRKI